MGRTISAADRATKMKIQLAIDTYTRLSLRIRDNVTLKILSHYDGKPVTVTDEQVHTLATALETVSDMNPYTAGNVTVVYPYPNYMQSHGVTWNDSIDKLMTLNTTIFDKGVEFGERAMGGFMPTFVNGKTHLAEYTVYHEWGHVTDPMLRDLDHYSNDRLDHMQYLMFTNQLDADLFESTLSSYGQMSDPEANAEAHAEFFLTRGRTTNYAAKLFAKENGWKIPLKYQTLTDHHTPRNTPVRKYVHN